MKKAALAVLLALFSVLSLQATSFADDKMAEFFGYLVEKDYDTGIDRLFRGSLLEEKLKVPQTRANWLAQLDQINSQYGRFLDFEKVANIRLGEIEVTTYFVYCDNYAVRFEITEYNNGTTSGIINFIFDDKVLSTVNTYGDVITY